MSRGEKFKDEEIKFAPLRWRAPHKNLSNLKSLNGELDSLNKIYNSDKHITDILPDSKIKKSSGVRPPASGLRPPERKKDRIKLLNKEEYNKNIKKKNRKQTNCN